MLAALPSSSRLPPTTAMKFDPAHHDLFARLCWEFGAEFALKSLDAKKSVSS
jgi:hypothetical protein